MSVVICDILCLSAQKSEKKKSHTFSLMESEDLFVWFIVHLSDISNIMNIHLVTQFLKDEKVERVKVIAE